MPDAALAPSSATTTRILTAVSVTLAVCVIVPLVWVNVAAWEEMERSDDPLAGLGVFLAVLYGAPALAGAAISLLGLPWARRTAGTVLAVVGLTISAVAFFAASSTWGIFLGF